jgi:pimeloyl-ACP methyl ester carboxylesterase
LKFKLNYIEIEPEQVYFDSIVIIFLHEALGSIGQWKSFPEHLCNELGLKGIVYERQGHGKSSAFSQERDQYYLHNYAFEELPAFIESVISPDKKILLVGHSDGGTIALLYASKFPQRISGIVTMAAHVINEKETIAGIQPAIDAYLEGKLDGLKKYHGEKTHDLFYAWATIWRDERFEDWNIVSEIGGDFPGLFIQGMDDQYGTPKQLELIQSKFKNGNTLLLDDCGHHPHLEKEKAVISSINSFYQMKITSF